MEVLKDKEIVLGVTGSIAFYKALDLASKLVQAGARVEVVLSHGATQLVTPLAFQGITHRPVVTSLFDPHSELGMDHVALAQRADVVVVAPATAHFLAKVACGLADDALTTTILATKAPVVLAPAMDAHMYQNPATQENLARLRERGYTLVGPAYGRLASGWTGMGRLAEVEEILGHIRRVLGREGDLAGKTVVVSAGGTQEPIDPVRVVTNRSSGKMGYALAEAARDRGARVILVAAPTSLPDPVGVEVVHVRTAGEMAAVLLPLCRGEGVSSTTPPQVLIMAAAVADYRPVASLPSKVKKEAHTWVLEMVKNPDILKEVPGHLIKVGFALETEDLVPNARKKLEEKGLHLVVANEASVGFGGDETQVILVDREGGVEELPRMSKREVAHRILDRVVALMSK